MTVTLSKGNKKLKDLFLLFNLPTKITCPGRTKLCEEACYGSKAERLYPDVLPSRMKNYLKSKEDTFVNDITYAVKRLRGRNRMLFRIHESGDFYSQEYFEKWCKVAVNIPDMLFLAYTKNFKLNLHNKPKNLKIYYSIFPDTDMTKVPEEELRAFTYGRRKKIDYTINDERFEDAYECDGQKCADCKICFEEGIDVKFRFH